MKHLKAAGIFSIVMTMVVLVQCLSPSPSLSFSSPNVSASTMQPNGTQPPPRPSASQMQRNGTQPPQTPSASTPHPHQSPSPSRSSASPMQPNGTQPPPRPSASTPNLYQSPPPSRPSSSQTHSNPSPPPPRPSASTAHPHQSPPPSRPSALPTHSHPSPPPPRPSASTPHSHPSPPPSRPSALPTHSHPSPPPPRPSASTPHPHQSPPQPRPSALSTLSRPSRPPPRPSASTPYHITPTSTAMNTGPTNSDITVVHGNWANWGEWICSVGCGSGTKMRNRTCTNPPPSGGGSECSGVAVDSGNCNNKPCAKIKVNVAITITSMVWSSSLANPNSTEFQNAENNFTSWGNQTFGKKKDYKGIENFNLTQGSVIADFDVVFAASSSPSEQPDYQNDIRTAVSSGNIGSLEVDANSLQTTETVEGVQFGNWGTDLRLCSSSCCDGVPSTVYQNRTCTPIATSCSGLLVVKKTDCHGSGCTISHCSGGILMQISVITMGICVLTSLWFLQ